jgi:hypothetical protein
LGVPGVWLLRAERQDRLNQDLLGTIKREDTPAALSLLAEGADANACLEPQIPILPRILEFMRGVRSKPVTGVNALLLSLGVSETNHGWGGQSFVSRKDDPELVDALLKHGAKISELDDSEMSPLSHAIFARMSRSARVLVEHGADIQSEFGPDRLTPLAMAVYTEDTNSIRLLLRHHADPNVRLTNLDDASTVLEYSLRNHRYEIVALLRAAGAR